MTVGSRDSSNAEAIINQKKTLVDPDVVFLAARASK